MSILAVDRRAWRALFAAQLGWMLDAMDFLLFSFAVIPIREEFGLSNATMGALTSVALIASALGGMLFGRLADRLGRVRALSLSILLYSAATAGLATSAALWELVAWRVAARLGLGGGGTGDERRALATRRVARRGRIGHGRRVVVRLGARRGDVAGRASRQSDG